MSRNNIYATPRIVTNLRECNFYHSTDIPGHGTIEGQWDLRGGEKEYLGGEDLAGKRVLEVGTASGFLCFHMERQGADVVGYDLSENQSWDAVPFSQYDYKKYLQDKKSRIRGLNSAFWYCHRLYDSKARLVHGTVYSIPEEIGVVDVSTFGCVLLHVRDPFLALQNALRLTKETVIVTDIVGEEMSDGLPIKFLPDFRKSEPKGSWWILSPEIVQEFIGVLGFEESEVKFHSQRRGNGDPTRLYTVIGRRTREMEPLVGI